MSEIEIRDICRQDYKKIYPMTAEGMHFNWYTDSRFLQNLYARYFFSMELNRATRVYGAYVDGRFAGALLACMKDEMPSHRGFLRGCLVRLLDRLQAFAAGSGGDVYDAANQRMFRVFCKEHTPDGEITFLAADPHSGVKGVGTALLSALAKDVPGKLVYLYTDDACNFGFYEHCGFTLADREDIVLDLKERQVPLKCMLYAKRMGGHPGH
jgi:ribosomal protein S18 acetylase RimI-like enzyme